ncbi:hypothetical protein M378DRAFT_186080 [Amanita muscaria Koide BX008]|uniref:Uncharacterized protein n=1 Tax=Amanita muscaria (strain Koide BX008) TaxID=946122 RepID=A0A0C2XAB9_AMAMK|nr:hypothetical protein M378DRAFT_186080 [Amanita muscaria Koide BX008]
MISKTTSRLFLHRSPSLPHRADPALAFVIGLSIILIASILNAAGLNLTKLDHVRTSSIPKASRKRDCMRPLWLLGMILYILSQLIGSTLALAYMRAEYVAPLGSSSLIFNFLFARFLVGTPVTRNDIYGTIVVVLGVVGIVAFGSINSGLTTEMDAARLSALWSRLNWLGYFFAMTLALALLLIFITRLEVVLATRNDVTEDNRSPNLPPVSSFWDRFGKFGRFVKATQFYWGKTMSWITERLETWTAPQPDKQIAWTLGIGWACCGGGLAGACLVFAKASVKLVSGSLSHENTGNQFGHVSTIFTFIFLAVTAVAQIICLNKGLKVYDSTLVVPVFNNEIGAYKGWTLFLIFLSIMVLISGVVLLTLTKPDPNGKVKSATLPRARRNRSSRPTADAESRGNIEDGDDEQDMLWEVGNASDDEDQGPDEDIDHHQHALYGQDGAKSSKKRVRIISGSEEGVGLIPTNDEVVTDGNR